MNDKERHGQLHPMWLLLLIFHIQIVHLIYIYIWQPRWLFDRKLGIYNPRIEFQQLLYAQLRRLRLQNLQYLVLIEEYWILFKLRIFTGAHLYIWIHLQIWHPIRILLHYFIILIYVSSVANAISIAELTDWNKFICYLGIVDGISLANMKWCVYNFLFVWVDANLNRFFMVDWIILTIYIIVVMLIHIFIFYQKV